MGMKYLISVVLGLFILSSVGCETFQRLAEEENRRREAAEARRREEYRDNYCNYNGAYVLGVNDGKDRVDMRLHMARSCDLKDRADAERGYREGYAAGLKSAPPIPLMTRGSWDCSDSILSRSGEIDFTRCRHPEKRWSCYEEVEKRCSERRTGAVEREREKRYTFCAESLSECW